MSVTSDLTDFGYRELGMAGDLLKALKTSKDSTERLGASVSLCMNPNSGYVFLTDEDFNVAMMNGDRLEDYLYCPECGHEGFKDEMQHEGNSGCIEYLRDIGLLDCDHDTNDACTPCSECEKCKEELTTEFGLCPDCAQDHEVPA